MARRANTPTIGDRALAMLMRSKSSWFTTSQLALRLGAPRPAVYRVLQGLAEDGKILCEVQEHEINHERRWRISP